jgi:peptide/nickel transport system substrate-binding protein
MSFQDSVMDRHIDAARFASDAALYESSVKAFIARAMSETPRIPLYQANLDVAMKPSLQGYRYWFHRQLDFRQLHKEL